MVLSFVMMFVCLKSFYKLYSSKLFLPFDIMFIKVSILKENNQSLTKYDVYFLNKVNIYHLVFLHSNSFNWFEMNYTKIQMISH